LSKAKIAAWAAATLASLFIGFISLLTHLLKNTSKRVFLELHATAFVNI